MTAVEAEVVLTVVVTVVITVEVKVRLRVERDKVPAAHLLALSVP